MKITKKITINKPAIDVWQILGEDFDKAGDWMAVVNHSYSTSEQNKPEEAPFAGRVCEFSPDGPNGFTANEMLTYFNREEYRVKFRVTPNNAPSVLPMEYNDADVMVKRIDDNTSEVIWTAEPKLKTVGKIMRPVVKQFLSKSFVEVLEELKHYAETGEVHPRKAKKMAKLAA